MIAAIWAQDENGLIGKDDKLPWYLPDDLQFFKQIDGITFITGGGEIYKAFLPHTDVLYRTLIQATFDGDTYFPYIDWGEWNIVSTSEGSVNADNPYPHDFETYQRHQS